MLEKSVSDTKLYLNLILDGTACEQGRLGYGRNCYLF